MSVKNQHAPRDRNVCNLLDNLQSSHIVTIIVIISFILVLCILIILTLTAALTKICVLCSARTSGRRTVCSALTTNHLNDGLWS